jgi:hypothetical protein
MEEMNVGIGLINCYLCFIVDSHQFLWERRFEDKRPCRIRSISTSVERRDITSQCSIAFITTAKQINYKKKYRERD